MCFESCDDGNVITTELDFQEIFETCENGDLVLFKTKSNPSESLSVQLQGVTLNDFFNVDDTGVFENTYNISSSNPFNYHTYSNASLPNDLFCNAIPNSEVNILEDNEATSGFVDVRTTLIEDDNDGIPAELEDRNNNGNLDDDDTDGDGLPDYIDVDDDGDNVLTRNENPDPNNDESLTDAQDTDADGIPDYLDDDDDGDGVKTINEENDSQDNNPSNDITNNDIGPDFLNPSISTSVSATSYRSHTISRTYNVLVTIRSIDLNFASFDTFSFGLLDSNQIPSDLTSISIIPDFN